MQVNEIFTPETVRMSLNRIVGLADEMVLRSLLGGRIPLLCTCSWHDLFA